MTSGAGSKIARQPMNNAMKSKLNLLVVACALQVSVTHAQSESKPNLSLTLAPVDAASAAGTGAGSDAKAAEAELAKKLQNPIANLISMPIQNNWDFGIGPENAMRYTANIQPVIPFSISQDWNLITRTILPVIYAESLVPGGSAKSGLGDVTQSFFLSPKEPVGGWILGAGPVALWRLGEHEPLTPGWQYILGARPNDWPVRPARIAGRRSRSRFWDLENPHFRNQIHSSAALWAWVSHASATG